ncbi:granule-bound starch synthase 1, chloroplastic/amyloplastic, partial [Genlisea aurea]
MASLTASFVVCHVNGGAASGDTSTNLSLLGVWKQQPATTHNGLRSVRKLQASSAGKSRRLVKRCGTPGTIVCGTGMNLVFVSAECGPWSKTGGLGDVLGGLPAALAANGHRVMTVSPRYDQYKDAWDTCVLVEVKAGDRTETVRFFHCYKRGVDRVFVDHPVFLEKVWGKTKSKIYGPEAGTDYEDNQLRFSMLCQAALEAPRVLNLNNNKHFSGPYGEDVVFVANDWHTALLPCYLKTMYQSRGIYMNSKARFLLSALEFQVAFCIHNIAYQGRFAFSDFGLLNLPDGYKSSFDFMDGYDKPVKGRKINWMKAAIIESHRVVTVSPYYAQELISGDDKGVELDSIIRRYGITGITNGMDVQEWNPSTDKYIPYHYDITTVMDAKPLLKEALQAAVGLPVDGNVPVIGFIGRLEEQKGSDILVSAVSKFIGLNVQVIILGTGKKKFEQQIEDLELLYPEKARGVAKFDSPLAHLITAGADFMLIPSRFEPCGLIQLHAMRYGTIPICASTGGLVDTVRDGDTGFHMGEFNVECKVVDPSDVTKVARGVERAVEAYETTGLKQMIHSCMSQDFSWKGAAKKWETLLLSLGVAESVEGEDV